MSTSLTGNLSAIRTQRILYSFHQHIRLRIPPITAKIRRRKLTNWSLTGHAGRQTSGSARLELT